MTVKAAPSAMSAVKPPRVQVGPIAWLRDNLFSSIGNSLLTLFGLYVIWVIVSSFLGWGILNATWIAKDGGDCRVNSGACWPFVGAKFGQFMYGRYPDAERWRVNLTYFLALAGLVPLMIPSGTALRRIAVIGAGLVAGGAAFVALSNIFANGLTGAFPVGSMTTVIAAVAILLVLSLLVQRYSGLRVPLGLYTFLVFPILAFFLLYGGSFGLRAVPTELWGGLLVTLVVASTGIAASFPLGVCLALGRRSKMPLVRWASVGFIEFIRGVPLITILFMSSVMLPLFLPPDVTFDKLLRALVGVALFSAAYMAEVVRGGLQAIPRGQFEAADALGLGYLQKMGFIVLPQALKLVIPGIVSSAIGLFKDTSLVLIIGLFDLLGVTQQNMSDQKWFSPTTVMTGYVFAGMIFWIFCYGMSRYSQMLERRLSAGDRR
jgi:general L-amino acid transport system permease protein